MDKFPKVTFEKVAPGTMGYDFVAGVPPVNVSTMFYDALVCQLKQLASGELVLVPTEGRTTGNVVKTLLGRGLVRGMDYEFATANRAPDGSRYPVGQKPWRFHRLWDGSKVRKLNGPTIKKRTPTDLIFLTPPTPPILEGQVSVGEAMAALRKYGKL